MAFSIEANRARVIRGNVNHNYHARDRHASHGERNAAGETINDSKASAFLSFKDYMRNVLVSVVDKRTFYYAPAALFYPHRSIFFSF